MVGLGEGRGRLWVFGVRLCGFGFGTTGVGSIAFIKIVYHIDQLQKPRILARLSL